MVRFLLAFSVVSFFLLSCSSNKVLKKVDPLAVNELIDSMRTTVTDYKWFSAKARIKFEGEEMRLTGRCNIRMIKDSLIWMNFKKLSVEGSRVLITQDSFWIVYRLDKMYESGTLKELLDAYDLNLSFNELQDFIVGNFPIPEPDQVSNHKTERFFHHLSFRDEKADYTYALLHHFLPSKVYLKDDLGREISVNFEEYDDSRMAMKKDFIVALEEGSQASISFNFSNVELDVEKSIKFDVPKHYRRLP